MACPACTFCSGWTPSLPDEWVRNMSNCCRDPVNNPVVSCNYTNFFDPNAQVSIPYPNNTPGSLCYSFFQSCIDNPAVCSPTVKDQVNKCLYLQNGGVTLNSLYRVGADLIPFVEEFMTRSGLVTELSNVLTGYSVRITIFMYGVIFLLFGSLLVLAMYLDAIAVTPGVYALIVLFITLVLLFFIQQLEIRNFLTDQRETFNRSVINSSLNFLQDIRIDTLNGYLENIKCSCLPNVCCPDPTNPDHCPILRLS